MVCWTCDWFLQPPIHCVRMHIVMCIDALKSLQFRCNDEIGMISLNTLYTQQKANESHRRAHLNQATGIHISQFIDFSTMNYILSVQIRKHLMKSSLNIKFKNENQLKYDHYYYCIDKRFLRAEQCLCVNYIVIKIVRCILKIFK